MDRQTRVSRDMEGDAMILAGLVISLSWISYVVVLANQYCRELENIRAFFQKKANGSLYRRVNPRKRNEDSQKIAAFRVQLREWIARFGVCFVQVRLNNYLISDQLSESLKGPEHQSLSIHGLLQELFAKRERELEDEQIDGARKTQEALVSVKAVGSLASNLENLHIRNDGPHPGDPYTSVFPPSMPMPMPVTFEHSQHPTIQPEFPFPMSSSTEGDLRAAQAARFKKLDDERRDEREQLRRAEQEYNNLPYLTPSMHGEQDHRPSHRPNVPSMTFSRVDEDDSAAAARALHEEYQRQFELEDRQQAIFEAGKLQMEAEEQEQALEFKRKKNHDRKRSSHHDPIGNGHPPPIAPSSPQNIGPMSFDNLEGAGVSIGGGPVHIHNGGGNTTTITYRDSHNDNSVRYYYGR